jgi:hypothetical protein
MSVDYNKMFQDAKAELESLQRIKANHESQLEEVNAKIDAMARTYNAIAPLVGEQPIPTLTDLIVNTRIELLKAAGISVAARSVIDSSPQEIFTPSMVRDQLAQKGWDWSGYANPLATVHTVLVRLAESKAIKDTTKDGRRAFHSVKRIEPIAPIRLTARGLGIPAIGLPQVEMLNPGPPIGRQGHTRIPPVKGPREK